MHLRVGQKKTLPIESTLIFQCSRKSQSLQHNTLATKSTPSYKVTLANRKQLLCYIVMSGYKKHIIRPADIRKVRKPAAYKWAINVIRPSYP